MVDPFLVGILIIIFFVAIGLAARIVEWIEAWWRWHREDR